MIFFIQGVSLKMMEEVRHSMKLFVWINIVRGSRYAFSAILILHLNSHCVLSLQQL